MRILGHPRRLLLTAQSASSLVAALRDRPRQKITGEGSCLRCVLLAQTRRDMADTTTFFQDVLDDGTSIAGEVRMMPGSTAYVRWQEKGGKAVVRNPHTRDRQVSRESFLLRDPVVVPPAGALGLATPSTARSCSPLSRRGID
jgi:hypothetical protein